MTNESSAARKDQPVILAEKPDYVLFGIAVFVWLLPITFVGSMGKSIPGVGLYANDLFRVAALFPTRHTGSVVYYAQVQTKQSSTWQVVDLRDYAKILMSGNRTRLDRVFQNSISFDAIKHPRGIKQRQQIAEFIKSKHEAEHPEIGEIKALRFLAVRFPVNESMAKRRGRWVNWPLEKIPEAQRKEMSVHFFDGRPPVNSFVRPQQPDSTQLLDDLPELDLPEPSESNQAPSEQDRSGSDSSLPDLMELELPDLPE